MSVDDQLRDVARRADQHQTVITATEIVRRASVRATGRNSRQTDRHQSVHQMPTGFPEEEVTMVDLKTSSNTAQHRRTPRLIVLGSLAAAAVVAVIAVVAIRDDEPANTTPAAEGDPTTLALGTDVEFVGDEGLAGQTLNVMAEERDGEVTGQFRIEENVTNIECADTSTDGFVILGGVAVSGPSVTEGDRLVLVIREGNPAAAALLGYPDGSSCTDLLASISADYLADDSNFAIVEDGYDIKTG